MKDMQDHIYDMMQQILSSEKIIVQPLDVNISDKDFLIALAKGLIYFSGIKNDLNAEVLHLLGRQVFVAINTPDSPMDWQSELLTQIGDSKDALNNKINEILICLRKEKSKNQKEIFKSLVEYVSLLTFILKEIIKEKIDELLEKSDKNFLLSIKKLSMAAEAIDMKEEGGHSLASTYKEIFGKKENPSSPQHIELVLQAAISTWITLSNIIADAINSYCSLGKNAIQKKDKPSDFGFGSGIFQKHKHIEEIKNEIKNLYNQADSEYKNENYQAALVIFSNVQEKCDQYANEWPDNMNFFRGYEGSTLNYAHLCYKKLGELDKAIDEIKKAINCFENVDEKRKNQCQEILEQLEEKQALIEKDQHQSLRKT